MKEETRLVTAGRRPNEHNGAVNPPVQRASTFLFPDLETMRSGEAPFGYGRAGTVTHRCFEEGVRDLEGGFETRLAPSGLAALTSGILAFCQAGDHILVTDSAYDPVRAFCNRFLARFGVETEYYDPLIGADIAGLFRPNTKVVLAETPGSLTFEMQDVPAIAKATKAAGVRLLVDNTYGAGVLFKPLAVGADLSIQSATKYIIGHADAMAGVLTSGDAETAAAVRAALRQLGSFVSPDEAYAGQRGLRSLHTRLRQHEASALVVATWLQGRDEVAEMLHPALPETPGHDIWRRDFSGSNGLFSIVLKPASDAAVTAMLNGFELFGMGYSWGGFESLIIPARPDAFRSATQWRRDGPLLRLHIGLENPEDLIADLKLGFDRLNAAA